MFYGTLKVFIFEFDSHGNYKLSFYGKINTMLVNYKNVDIFGQIFLLSMICCNHNKTPIDILNVFQDWKMCFSSQSEEVLSTYLRAKEEAGNMILQADQSLSAAEQKNEGTI